MKKMVCDICGSQSIKKESGTFICQDCVTEYSLEEARNLLKEVGEAGASTPVVNVVQETPVVPQPIVNNEAIIENHLENARRAYKNSDFEEAEKYFNKAEECSAKCVEAIVYSAICKARISLSVNDQKARTTVFNILCKSIKNISDFYNVEERGYYKELLRKIMYSLKALISANYVYNKWYSYEQKKYLDNSADTILLFVNIYDAIITLQEKLLKIDKQYYMYTLSEIILPPLSKTMHPQSPRASLIEKNKKSFHARLFDHYWGDNPDRKKEIENEINEYLAKNKELTKSVNNLHETHKLNEINNKIKKLQEELYSLGFLKFKRKKELRNQILVLEENELKEAIQAQNKAANGCNQEIKKNNEEIKKLQNIILNDPTFFANL